MARPRNRLNVTLSPEVMDELARLSEVSGIAASAFVASVMNDSLPILQAMNRAFTEAKKAPLKAAETMQEALTATMVQAAQESLAFTERATKSAKLRHTTRKRRK